MKKNKIKVCHVTSAHARDDTRIFQKECKSLNNAGYQVYLLVNDALPSEKVAGVNIISTGIQPKNRAERFVKTKKKMLRLALGIDAQIYQFHDPDLIGFALKLKKKKPNIKIIFDSHEDIPAQILKKEWIPSMLRGLLSKGFEKYQNSTLKKFDYLIGVTPHLVKKLKKINNRIEMVTNYPLLEKEMEKAMEGKEKPLKSNHMLCFAGGISKQWNHHRILQALEKVNVKYVLCGSGEEEYIEELKKYSTWNRVSYKGRIPFEEVKKIYQEAQIGMALLAYSPNTDYKQGTLGNTKIFEYMQAGLPVICTDFALWKAIVEKNRCGICVNPADLKAIREAIGYLSNNPEACKAMGQNGKKLVEKKLNWDSQFFKLLKVYNEVLCGAEKC